MPPLVTDDFRTFRSDFAEDGAVIEAAVGGGNAVAFTLQSPDKATGNEDGYALVHYGADACALIVADGAGGLPNARQASQTAVATIVETLATAHGAGAPLVSVMAAAIATANDEIMAQCNQSATTLTALAIDGREAHCFHVGDSAALVTGQRGAMRFQTVGHSPVSFAVAAGLLSEEQAMYHIDRHIVSNFLGNPLMRIDISPAFSLAARDTILVCSDGLTDNLLTHEIVELMRCGPLAEVVPALIQAATQRMLCFTDDKPSKPDDLTLILFRKPPAPRR